MPREASFIDEKTIALLRADNSLALTILTFLASGDYSLIEISTMLAENAKSLNISLANLVDTSLVSRNGDSYSLAKRGRDILVHFDKATTR